MYLILKSGMAGSSVIDHEGIVEQVTDDTAKIIIDSQSACASCHAKGACSAADQTEKILFVPTEGKTVQPGETVKVLISRRTGLRAVAFGYIYPFLLLMLVLIVMTIAGLSELHAGLYALLSLLPYYLAIYLMRNKLGNSFTFKLEKTNFDL